MYIEFALLLLVLDDASFEFNTLVIWTVLSVYFEL